MSVFGPEWVIYTTGFILVQTFLFWTHLRLLICGRGNVALENHFHQYQHLIHVGRAADVCLSNQAAAHCR